MHLAVLDVGRYFCWPLMRRLFSILFLALMLLQAIPVLHFFSSHKAVFYTYVDEEKPEQKSKIEKKDQADYLSVTENLFLEEKNPAVYVLFLAATPSSPLLEYATPPPDAC